MHHGGAPYNLVLHRRAMQLQMLDNNHFSNILFVVYLYLQIHSLLLSFLSEWAVSGRTVSSHDTSIQNISLVQTHSVFQVCAGTGFETDLLPATDRKLNAMLPSSRIAKLQNQ
jgi:hypothetical protein